MGAIPRMEGDPQRGSLRRSPVSVQPSTSPTPTALSREPRYYQRTAVNRAIEAILGGEAPLLTMATGTGKTFVSMQIAWKLWNSEWIHGRRPESSTLQIETSLSTSQSNGSSSPPSAVTRITIWKLRGQAKAGREIYFGLYQQLADGGAGPNGMFRQFAPDF